MSTFHAGQTFGEASLLYNSPRGASVRAKTDVTLLVIDRPAFQRLSGAGSRFLQHAFLRHASVRRRGQAFMSKQDFLRAMHSTAAAAAAAPPSALATQPSSMAPCDLSRLDRLMLRLVARNTDSEAISFSEFVHFDMLMSSADRELLVLFHLLDRDKNGLIDRDEFCHFVAEQQSPPQTAADAFTRHPLVVDLFGANGERRLSEWQFRRLLGGGADSAQTPPAASSILSYFYTNSTDAVAVAGASRRRAMASMLPHIFSDIDSLSRALERTSFGADLVLTAPLPSHAPLFSATDHQHLNDQPPAVAATSSLYLLGSGFAGAVARTAVAPIERVRLLMQTQPLSAGLPTRDRLAVSTSGAGIRSVWQGLSAVYKSDGIGGLFRGNGLNAARIVPCIALEFAAFEFFKRAWIGSDAFARFHPHESSARAASHASTHHHHAADRLSLGELALIGGAAGICSNALFYPLDLLRALVTVQRGPSSGSRVTGTATGTDTAPASVRRARDFIASIWRAEGARGFFRGFGTSMIYIFPYAGATVAASESLRPLLPRDSDGNAATTSPLWLIAGSALAGLVGQTLGAGLLAFDGDYIHF